MKPIIVQKYGGSSVADVERLQAVAQRVVATVAAGNRVVVVISAMGGTTDQLLQLAARLSDAPPRRELDMLVSAGERIASALLAMAVDQLGTPAISFTGSQCGIITNHRHTDARIMEVRPYRVQDELDEGRVVIIAGYQGVSYKREVTTLGRGGSDTTAVAMAAALGAVYCEICSDVDGVYTADPKVVPEAAHLARLGYEEMQLLALHGAKVLNAQAVEFARAHGIAIHARATSGSTRQTVIGSEGVGGPVGIAALRGLSVVRGAGGASQLAAIEATLAAAGAEPLWARACGDQVELAVAVSDGPDGALLRAALGALVGASVDGGLDAITLVGSAPAHRGAIQRELLDAAAACGAEVIAIDSQALRHVLVLAPGASPAVQRHVHARIFGGDPVADLA